MSRPWEGTVERLLFGAALVSALVTVFIFGFMFVLGLPLFAGGGFFAIISRPWAPQLGSFGIAPMIGGSLAVSLLAMGIAFPLSMGCAILVSGIDAGRFGRLLRRVVEMMTGVPTVIYGFVGIFLLVPLVRQMAGGGSGMCVLSAALMLALLISPTMILFFSDSFARVPQSHGNAVLAAGGTDVQKFLYVTLPCARQGIAAGLVLALGRALGDTLIALMIAGNAVQPPASIFASARTLTSHIALVFAADYESLEFKAIFACGITLYVFTTLLVLLVRRSGAGVRRNRP
jgi:phosphate transport system permease protein